jgi:tetratricopeptide (TPR) repeat protein
MFDQAIKDFTAAVVLNPMFSDAYLNRGRAYSEKGLPEEAMNDFNQAIKADSDHAFGFVDRAAPAIHTDEESSDNREEAAKFNQQGMADLKNEKYKEAAENFTKAINLAGSDAEGYINRGRVYIKLEKTDEAIADFKQAILFDPLNPSLYYWRAQAWKAKDDQFNMTEDLKLSCEMGYEPACVEYRKRKSPKK